MNVETEPSTDSVAPCLEYARHVESDVIVGLGGGSVLDTTKAVAMLLKNEGTVEDYLGTGLVKHGGVPNILLPTTAGTGAEVTPNALLSEPFALEAIRLIAANLRGAVIDGQNLAAREGMALGSLCAAISPAPGG